MSNGRHLSYNHIDLIGQQNININKNISNQQFQTSNLKKNRYLYVKLIPDNYTQNSTDQNSGLNNQTNSDSIISADAAQNDSTSNSSTIDNNDTTSLNSTDFVNQTINDNSTDDSNQTTNQIDNPDQNQTSNENSTSNIDQPNIDETQNQTCSQDSSSECHQNDTSQNYKQQGNIQYYAQIVNQNNLDIGPKLIANTYFIFTTFSKVGFGDYYPVRDSEKWVFIVIFIFSLFIFSYVLMTIQYMIKRASNFDSDFYEEIQLDGFFALIKRFNMHKFIDKDQQDKIIEVLKLRWDQNRNNFIRKTEDFKILDNLPENLMRRIYTEFIFKDFLKMFRRFLNFSEKNLKDQEQIYQNGLLSQNISKMHSFVIQSKNIFRLRKKVRSIMHVLRTFRNIQNEENKHLKQLTKNEVQEQIARFRVQIEKINQKKEMERKQKIQDFKNDFYGNQKGNIKFPYKCYTDDEYQNFVILLLQSLEIRQFKKGEIIAKEIDECNEILFVISGKYNVGYDINRKTIYRKQFGCQTIIGAFQMNFNSRYQFYYKVSKEMICYSVSRRKWFQLKQNFPSFCKLIKEKSLQTYNKHIYRPLMTLKNKDIKQYQNRKDFQQILASKDSNFDFIRQCLNEMKQESMKEVQKQKFQKIDLIKINWLINTIEQKLQNYFQIAYQMTQRQEFMRILLWEKITLAISKDSVENPQQFIQQFREILVQGISKKDIQDINYSYEEKKLKDMQIKLMKQSMKIFNDNHYRRIMNQIKQEEQRQNISQNQKYFDQNKQSKIYSNSQSFESKDYMLKRQKTDTNQISRVEERSDENVDIDSENSYPIELNKRNIINEQNSLEESHEQLLVQSKTQQVKNSYKIRNQSSKKKNQNNKTQYHGNHPIVIQQSYIDYETQDYQRSQKQQSRSHNKLVNQIINVKKYQQNKIQMFDYDGDYEEVGRDQQPYIKQNKDLQSQNEQREIQTPPDKNHKKRDQNLQIRRSHSNQNELNHENRSEQKSHKDMQIEDY